MLVTFLFIVRVGCEWVEISQQNYRQPLRLGQHHDITRENVEEDYTNHSVSEYKWNTQTAINTPGRIKIIAGHYDEEFNKQQYKTRNEERRTKGTIERIPNTGKVHRVQLIDTPVKSITTKLKSDSEVPIQTIKKSSYANNSTSFNTELENSNRRTANNIYVNEHEVKRVATDFVSEYHKDYDDNFGHHITKYELRNTSDRKIPPEDANQNNLLKDPNNTSSNKKQTHNINNKNKDNKDCTQFVTDNPKTLNKPKTAEESLMNVTLYAPEMEKLKRTGESDHKDCNESHYREKTNIVESTTEETLPSHEKSNAVELIVKFMKVVSDNISANTRRNFGSKVRYLEDLKNTILANIKERIDATWPEDHEERHRRSTASNDNARGHLEFPSSESTLMTISFLTFAVFLIKLVLQVIQTYKNKTMMVAPLVVATAGRVMNHLQRN